MRALIFLIEVLLPLSFIFGVLFVAYKILTFHSSYKKWKTESKTKKDERHNHPFSDYLNDYETLISVFDKKLPKEALQNFIAIKTLIQNLQTKATQENWDSKNKPQNIYLLADILYKHIPELLDEFTQIPQNIAKTNKNNQGKTAIELINENSKILLTSFDEIVSDIFNENLQHLKVQQNIFKNKFQEQLTTSKEKEING